MPEAVLKKEGDYFIPVRIDDKEWMEGLKNGAAFYFKSAKKCRNPHFLRKYFAMLRHAFEHWEPEIPEEHKVRNFKVPPEKDFDRFREEMQILAGFYKLAFRTDGGLTKIATSISFDEMEDDADFQKVYNAVANVLIKVILTNYTYDDLDRVVSELIRFT
jgi:uncharacterized protein DUF1367